MIYTLASKDAQVELPKPELKEQIGPFWHLDFQYLQLDLRSLDREQLLADPNPLFALIVALALFPQDPAAKEILVRISQRLKEIKDKKLLAEVWSVFEALLRERGLYDQFLEVIQTIAGINIREFPTFQAGKEEGIKEGIVMTILSMLKSNLNLSSSELDTLERRLYTYSLEQLQDLVPKLTRATSFAMVLDLLP